MASISWSSGTSSGSVLNSLVSGLFPLREEAKPGHGLGPISTVENRPVPESSGAFLAKQASLGE